MKYDDNLLFTIVILTNAIEEDAIEIELSRHYVFEESHYHSTLRSVFNNELRKLAALGLVSLTRTKVAPTSKGFDAAWDRG